MLREVGPGPYFAIILSSRDLRGSIWKCYVRTGKRDRYDSNPGPLSLLCHSVCKVVQYTTWKITSVSGICKYLMSVKYGLLHPAIFWRQTSSEQDLLRLRGAVSISGLLLEFLVWSKQPTTTTDNRAVAFSNYVQRPLSKVIILLFHHTC